MKIELYGIKLLNNTLYRFCVRFRSETGENLLTMDGFRYDRNNSAVLDIRIPGRSPLSVGVVRSNKLSTAMMDALDVVINQSIQDYGDEASKEKIDFLMKQVVEVKQ